MKLTGIYKIQSLFHKERCYIGSAIDINRRFYVHLRNLRLKKHNPKFQHHFDKYSIRDLELEILESFEFKSKEHLLQREQFYIDLLKPYFNASPTACSPLGVKRNEEQRIRINNSHKGQIGWKSGLSFKKYKPLTHDEMKEKVREAFILHQQWINKQRMLIIIDKC